MPTEIKEVVSRAYPLDAEYLGVYAGDCLFDLRAWRNVLPTGPRAGTHVGTMRPQGRCASIAEQ